MTNPKKTLADYKIGEKVAVPLSKTGEFSFDFQSDGKNVVGTVLAQIAENNATLLGFNERPKDLNPGYKECEIAQYQNYGYGDLSKYSHGITVFNTLSAAEAETPKDAVIINLNKCQIGDRVEFPIGKSGWREEYTSKTVRDRIVLGTIIAEVGLDKIIVFETERSPAELGNVQSAYTKSITDAFRTKYSIEGKFQTYATLSGNSVLRLAPLAIEETKPAIEKTIQAPNASEEKRYLQDTKIGDRIEIGYDPISRSWCDPSQEGAIKSVATIAGKYKTSSTIFAWEQFDERLGESRCIAIDENTRQTHAIDKKFNFKYHTGYNPIVRVLSEDNAKNEEEKPASPAPKQLTLADAQLGDTVEVICDEDGYIYSSMKYSSRGVLQAKVVGVEGNRKFIAWETKRGNSSYQWKISDRDRTKLNIDARYNFGYSLPDDYEVNSIQKAEATFPMTEPVPQALPAEGISTTSSPPKITLSACSPGDKVMVSMNKESGGIFFEMKCSNLVPVQVVALDRENDKVFIVWENQDAVRTCKYDRTISDSDRQKFNINERFKFGHWARSITDAYLIEKAPTKMKASTITKKLISLNTTHIGDRVELPTNRDSGMFYPPMDNELLTSAVVLAHNGDRTLVAWEKKTHKDQTDMSETMRKSNSIDPKFVSAAWVYNMISVNLVEENKQEMISDQAAATKEAPTQSSEQKPLYLEDTKIKDRVDFTISKMNGFINEPNLPCYDERAIAIVCSAKNEGFTVFVAWEEPISEHLASLYKQPISDADRKRYSIDDRFKLGISIIAKVPVANSLPPKTIETKPLHTFQSGDVVRLGLLTDGTKCSLTIKDATQWQDSIEATVFINDRKETFVAWKEKPRIYEDYNQNDRIDRRSNEARFNYFNVPEEYKFGIQLYTVVAELVSKAPAPLVQKAELFKGGDVIKVGLSDSGMLNNRSKLADNQKRIEGTVFFSSSNQGPLLVWEGRPAQLDSYYRTDHVITDQQRKDYGIPKQFTYWCHLMATYEAELVKAAPIVEEKLATVKIEESVAPIKIVKDFKSGDVIKIGLTADNKFNHNIPLARQPKSINGTIFFTEDGKACLSWEDEQPSSITASYGEMKLDNVRHRYYGIPGNFLFGTPLKTTHQAELITAAAVAPSEKPTIKTIDQFQSGDIVEIGLTKDNAFDVNISYDQHPIKVKGTLFVDYSTANKTDVFIAWEEAEYPDEVHTAYGNNEDMQIDAAEYRQFRIPERFKFGTLLLNEHQARYLDHQDVILSPKEEDSLSSEKKLNQFQAGELVRIGLNENGLCQTDLLIKDFPAFFTAHIFPYPDSSRFLHPMMVWETEEPKEIVAAYGIKTITDTVRKAWNIPEKFKFGMEVDRHIYGEKFVMSEEVKQVDPIIPELKGIQIGDANDKTVPKSPFISTDYLKDAKAGDVVQLFVNNAGTIGIIENAVACITATVARGDRFGATFLVWEEIPNALSDIYRKIIDLDARSRWKIDPRFRFGVNLDTNDTIPIHIVSSASEAPMTAEAKPEEAPVATIIKKKPKARKDAGSSFGFLLGVAGAGIAMAGLTAESTSSSTNRKSTNKKEDAGI